MSNTEVELKVAVTEACEALHKLANRLFWLGLVMNGWPYWLATLTMHSPQFVKDIIVSFYYPKREDEDRTGSSPSIN